MKYSVRYYMAQIFSKRFFQILYTLLLLLLVCAPDYISPRHLLAEKKPQTSENFFKADFNDAPTLISSNEMILHANERRVEYNTEVEVIHGDMTLRCDNLEAFYTEKNQINRIFAKKNVRITRETGAQARSEHAVYTQKNETIVLTINPEVQENGSIVSAEKITIFLKEDKSKAEGDVRVKLVNTDKNQAKNKTKEKKPTKATSTELENSNLENGDLNNNGELFEENTAAPDEEIFQQTEDS